MDNQINTMENHLLTYAFVLIYMICIAAVTFGKPKTAKRGLAVLVVLLLALWITCLFTIIHTKL